MCAQHIVRAKSCEWRLLAAIVSHAAHPKLEFAFGVGIDEDHVPCCPFPLSGTGPNRSTGVKPQLSSAMVAFFRHTDRDKSVLTTPSELLSPYAPKNRGAPVTHVLRAVRALVPLCSPTDAVRQQRFPLLAAGLAQAWLTASPCNTTGTLRYATAREAAVGADGSVPRRYADDVAACAFALERVDDRVCRGGRRSMAASPGGGMAMEDGTYWMCEDGEQPVGGISDVSAARFEGIPAQWSAYLAVDDVDARSRRRPPHRQADTPDLRWAGSRPHRDPQGSNRRALGLDHPAPQ